MPPLEVTFPIVIAPGASTVTLPVAWVALVTVSVEVVEVSAAVPAVALTESSNSALRALAVTLAPVTAPVAVSVEPVEVIEVEPVPPATPARLTTPGAVTVAPMPLIAPVTVTSRPEATRTVEPLDVALATIASVAPVTSMKLLACITPALNVPLVESRSIWPPVEVTAPSATIPASPSTLPAPVVSPVTVSLPPPANRNTVPVSAVTLASVTSALRATFTLVAARTAPALSVVVGVDGPRSTAAAVERTSCSDTAPGALTETVPGAVSAPVAVTVVAAPLPVMLSVWFDGVVPVIVTLARLMLPGAVSARLLTRLVAPSVTAPGRVSAEKVSCAALTSSSASASTVPSVSGALAPVRRMPTLPVFAVPSGSPVTSAIPVMSMPVAASRMIAPVPAPAASARMVSGPVAPVALAIVPGEAL